MYERKSTAKGRDVAMTKADEAAFSRALKETFPGILFIQEERYETPELPWIESIEKATNANTLVGAMVPSPGWKPEVYWDLNSYWLTTPTRYFMLRRSVWDWTRRYNSQWAWDPPTLTMGYISASYWRDDAEGKYFVGKVWRILGKLTTNRFKVELPRSGRVIGSGAYDVWAGHDAVRWCSGGPLRMINGAFRPADDWTFPNLPWYREEEREEPEPPPEYLAELAGQ